MPNWCENILTIKGTETNINKLLNQIELTEQEVSDPKEVTKFDFNKVLPIPEGAYWYEWCVANWDTKWNASDVYIVRDYENKAHIQFQTAWSPPENVIRELAKQNPFVKLTLTYSESGADFYGEVEYVGDNEYEVENGTLSTASCEIKAKYIGGDHHYCEECNNYWDCNEMKADELCSECATEQELSEQLIDQDLWEGEISEAKVEVGQGNRA